MLAKTLDNNDPRLGSSIGHFMLHAELGRGGMGVVYLAEDQRLHRDVALKLIPGALLEEKRRRRFLREARAAARINHPHVTTVFEVGEVGPDAYIAMEYIEGQTLRTLLEGGPLPIPEALRMTRAIADGLERAHLAGIVHRDLKPENVMLSRQKHVKLLDFGLAKAIATTEPNAAFVGDDSSHSVTMDGRVVGTPRYMSPEQVLGKSLDYRSDLFSLGIVLFEMVTGERPFRGQTPMEVFIAISRDEPPLPSTRNPSVSPGLNRLILQCLAKNPEERFEGAFELRAAIEKLLAESKTMTSLDGAVPVSPGFGVEKQAHEPTMSSSQEREFESGAFSRATARSFTRDERGLMALIVVDLRRAPSETWRTSQAEALLWEIERSGGQGHVFPDGLVTATFWSRRIATDHAAHSARVAFALRKIVPDVPMGLSMGQFEGMMTRSPTDLLERARGALVRSALNDGTIALDEMTAGLLGAHFDVQHGERGSWLLDELQIAHGARTLLGKMTPCVGRDRELTELAALFRECVEEPLGRAVLIVAPPGTGKSRLAQELMRGLSRQFGAEISIWVGSADARGAGAALHSLRHALRTECAIVGNESLAEQRAKVTKRVSWSVESPDQARIIDFLGELMQVPFPDEKNAPLRAARQDAELMNEQMRRAFVDFIAAETTRRPLLLLLEDLHWGDLPTVRFIDAALREHGDKPCMVLALARPEVHERFPKLWADLDLRQIHLKKLSRKAAEHLIRETLGGAADEGMIDRIISLADGHAFYLEELIRAAAGGSTTLPATVVAMVQARLLDLSADARRLLRAASVFGEVFWQSAVEQIVDGAAAEILSELVEREILVRHLESKFPGEREYAFRHALLREGAYALLTEADLILGHRLAAEWLDLHNEPNPLVLAEHFERAEKPLIAAGYYRKAVAQAYFAGDLEAAIGHGERGLSCGATGIVREHLLGMLCDAYAQRWNFFRAAEIAEELLPRAQPGGMACVQAAKIRSVIALFSGRFDDCVNVVDAALAAVPAPEAIGALAQMVMMCVSILPLIGQPKQGNLYLEKLRELCRNAGSESIVAQGWMHFALAYVHLGSREDPWTALREAEASRICFTQCGYRKGFANAQIVVGMSAWFLGLAERAERELLDPSASDLDLPEMAGHRASILVDILVARGAIEEARRFASETVALRHAQQNRSEESHARHALARVHYAAGEWDAAAREALLARELAIFPVFHHWASLLLAAVRVSQGRTGEERSLAEQAVSACTALRNFNYRGTEIRLTMANVLQACGEEEAAQQWLRNSAEQIVAAASRIEDVDVRHSFLTKVAANARILEGART